MLQASNVDLDLLCSCRMPGKLPRCVGFLGDGGFFQAGGPFGENVHVHGSIGFSSVNCTMLENARGAAFLHELVILETLDVYCLALLARCACLALHKEKSLGCSETGGMCK